MDKLDFILRKLEVLEEGQKELSQSAARSATSRRNRFKATFVLLLLTKKNRQGKTPFRHEELSADA